MLKKNNKIIYLLIINFLLLPLYSYAALSIDLSGANPIGQTSIIGLINALVKAIVQIGAVVVIFFIIYAGFQFVRAQGNEDEITTAKKSFFYAVIGGVILLGAYTLSEVLCNTAVQLGAKVSCGGK